jgi:hypothetical protein
MEVTTRDRSYQGTPHISHRNSFPWKPKSIHEQPGLISIKAECSSLDFLHLGHIVPLKICTLIFFAWVAAYGKQVDTRDTFSLRLAIQVDARDVGILARCSAAQFHFS